MVVVLVLVVALVLVVVGALVVVVVDAVVGTEICITVWVWVDWARAVLVVLFAVIVYVWFTPLHAKGTVSAPLGPW